MHLHALPTCQPPYYETTVGSGVFTDTVGGSGRVCNPCSEGQRWSVAIADCVLDTAPSPPSSTNPPSSSSGPVPEWVWLAMGAVVLIALMPRRGGGGGRSRSSSSKLLSRTTTRSIFG